MPVKVRALLPPPVLTAMLENVLEDPYVPTWSMLLPLPRETATPLEADRITGADDPLIVVPSRPVTSYFPALRAWMSTSLAFVSPES